MEENQVQQNVEAQAANETAVVPAGNGSLIDPRDLPTGTRSLEEQFTDVSSIFYSSIQNDGSRDTAIKIYNAMNNTAGAIRDIQANGGTLQVTDLIAHNIRLLDENTGEMIDATRCVLIGPDGQGYHAVAGGVVSSIQKIVGIVGRAPWNPPLNVRPKLVKTRRGFYTMTIELLPTVAPAKK